LWVGKVTKKGFDTIAFDSLLFDINKIRKSNLMFIQALKPPTVTTNPKVKITYRIKCEGPKIATKKLGYLLEIQKE
jgi:hypothetical protein